MLGLSTTRRAAILAIVICALAFTVAVPLRTYLSQQSELSVQQQRHDRLQAKLHRLRERKSELNDPAVIEREARGRLGYVMPGETPYMVQLPGDSAAAEQGGDNARGGKQDPWYATLWDSINGGDSATEGDAEQ